MQVYRITWTEYEAGFGCRPDGAILYPTIASAQAHYTEWLAGETATTAPAIYSRPDINPFKVTPPMVEVSTEVFNTALYYNGVWE